MTWKLLDCTLRDGGYYNNWDFEEDLVRRYARTLGSMPVDVLEVGYRNLPMARYNGRYFHLSRRTLETLREYAGPHVDLAFMVDAKSVAPKDMAALLGSAQGAAEMVRIALDPAKIDHGLALAGSIKDLGFTVSVNLMYMHLHPDHPEVFGKLAAAEDRVDWVFLVDSFGSVFPDQVGEAVASAKAALPQRIGFHGHDNLHLAFANTLRAIDAGADMVDGSVLGMGRGAGNLKTELLLAYQTCALGRSVDLSGLGELLERFNANRDIYRWGTDLPYMISGFQRVPQKKVMKWIDMRRYSTSSIIRNVQGRVETPDPKPSFAQAAELKSAVAPKGVHTVVIIGGGPTVRRHRVALAQFASQEDALIIHSSLKNMANLGDLPNPRIICLAGDEGRRIVDADPDTLSRVVSFLISPVSGTEELLARGWAGKTFEVPASKKDRKGEDGFVKYDAPLSLALQVIDVVAPDKVFLAGFDGYGMADEAYREIETETQQILHTYARTHPDRPLRSLTPTKYDLDEISVHALIQER
jgi:4-hydroxy 2-oxovalerate aldolase